MQDHDHSAGIDQGRWKAALWYPDRSHAQRPDNAAHTDPSEERLFRERFNQLGLCHTASAGARPGGLDRRGGTGTNAVHRPGDFNRRFTQPNDRVWVALDDGEPANAELTTLGPDMPVSCRDNAFAEFIDHIAVDRRVLPWVDPTSFAQVTYHQADKAVRDQLSDHCPVLMEL